MKVFKLFLVIAAGVLVSAQVQAATGDISCIAEQYEVHRDGLKNHIKVPLEVEVKKNNVLVLSTEIEGRAYVLSGDTITGDFHLTQAWTPDYTTGINTTASFNSRGYLQISLVAQQFVFKLKCQKELAN